MLTVLPRSDESSDKKYVFFTLEHKLQRNAFKQLVLRNIKLYLRKPNTVIPSIKE